MRLVRMLRCPLWLVVAAELLAAVGDHRFFFGFLAVLADALNAAAVGLPVSPLRAMRSSLPASMRLRLAAMLAYRPGGFFISFYPCGFCRLLRGRLLRLAFAACPLSSPP